MSFVRDRANEHIHPKKLPSAPLFEAIRESKMTYRELEAKSCYAHGTVSSMMSTNSPKVTWDRVDRLCTALGIPAPLLYFKEW